MLAKLGFEDNSRISASMLTFNYPEDQLVASLAKDKTQSKNEAKKRSEQEKAKQAAKDLQLA